MACICIDLECSELRRSVTLLSIHPRYRIELRIFKLFTLSPLTERVIKSIIFIFDHVLSHFFPVVSVSECHTIANKVLVCFIHILKCSVQLQAFICHAEAARVNNVLYIFNLFRCCRFR